MENVIITEEQEQYEEQEQPVDDLAIVRVTSRCQLIDLGEEEV